MKIAPDQFYSPQSPELRQVAAVQTLARWRSEGRGPAYHKAGAKVLYLGADVLSWLAAGRVQTDAPQRRGQAAEPDSDPFRAFLRADAGRLAPGSSSRRR